MKTKIFVVGVVALFLTLCSCSARDKSAIEKRYDALLEANTSEQKAIARGYLIDSLSIDSLRNSPFWHNYLNAWAMSYGDSNEDKNLFAQDAQRMFSRMSQQPDTLITSFVHEMVNIFYDNKREEWAGTIAALPHNMMLVPGEHSEIGKRLAISVRIIGRKAPALGQVDFSTGKASIIVFFSVGCGVCAPAIDTLKQKHDWLKERNIRIISVSADSEREIYEASVATFPWEDKLCDYQSYNSPIFKTWGISHTPSLFFVDSEGIVKGTYENIEGLENEHLKELK